MKKLTQTLIAAGALTIASASPASLIGDTATCSFTFIGACSTSSAVISDAPEFILLATGGVPFLRIDIGDSFIQMDDLTGSPGLNLPFPLRFPFR